MKDILIRMESGLMGGAAEKKSLVSIICFSGGVYVASTLDSSSFLKNNKIRIERKKKEKKEQDKGATV